MFDPNPSSISPDGSQGQPQQFSIPLQNLQPTSAADLQRQMAYQLMYGKGQADKMTSPWQLGGNMANRLLGRTQLNQANQAQANTAARRADLDQGSISNGLGGPTMPPPPQYFSGSGSTGQATFPQDTTSPPPVAAPPPTPASATAMNTMQPQPPIPYPNATGQFPSSMGASAFNLMGNPDPFTMAGL